MTRFSTYATPDELFFGRKPSVKHLRVWGCDVYVHVNKADRVKDSKLEVRARPGIFIGYQANRMGYRCLVDGKIIISRDVRFVENEFTHMKKLTDEEARLEDDNGLMLEDDIDRHDMT